MSHFTQCNLQIRKRSALIKALVAMGYTKDSIELFDTPVALRNYYGKISDKKAHIRVSQKNRSGREFGFEFKEDGQAIMHYDHMDFNSKWQDDLMTQYAKATIYEIAEEKGFLVASEIKEADELVITVESLW
jgi:hypothetical protein